MIDFLGYVFVEIFSYVFTRVLLAVMISLGIAGAICWFLSDRESRVLVFGAAIVVGRPLGIMWEWLAHSKRREDDAR